MTRSTERRRWERLNVGMPMFLHRLDERSGRPALDFVSALNLSAGGALVVAPSYVSPQTEVALEIPEVPIMLDLGAREPHRKLQARVIRVESGKTFFLGLEFAETSRLGITATSPDA